MPVFQLYPMEVVGIILVFFKRKIKNANTVYGR